MACNKKENVNTCCGQIPGNGAKNGNGNCSIDIDEDMTVINAMRLKTYLLESLQSCQNLEIGLSGVSEIDTAGIQLLILLTKEARHSNKTVKMSNYSQAVKNVVELYRLSDLFGPE